MYKLGVNPNAPVRSAPVKSQEEKSLPLRLEFINLLFDKFPEIVALLMSELEKSTEGASKLIKFELEKLQLLKIVAFKEAPWKLALEKLQSEKIASLKSQRVKFA